MAMQVVIDGPISAKSVCETVPTRSAPRNEPRTRPNIHPCGLHQEPSLVALPCARVYCGEPPVQVIVDDDYLKVRLIGIIRQTETEVGDRFAETFGPSVGE